MLRFATLIFTLGFGFSAFGEIAPDDRIRGAFLGLAYGDARGLPTKSLTRDEIREIYGDDLSLKVQPPVAKILAVGGKKLVGRTRLPGFVSDETAQAMALQLALQHYPKWGEQGTRYFTRLLIDAYVQRVDRGFDKVYAKAVKRLSKGVDYHRSGSAFPGLGAAVRVGPLAGIDSDFEVGNPVRISSLITHADHRAFMLSLTVHAVNDLLLKGVDAAFVRKSVPLLLDQLEVDWLNDNEFVVDLTEAHSFLTTLKNVLARLPEAKSYDDISNFVIEAAEPWVDEQNGPLHPNGRFALLGGVHAIALALQDEAKPLEILRYISHLGAESDAVGAIAGSLLGARFGTSWIPLDELADRRRLESYADALVSGKPPESAPEYLARELENSAKERAYQEMLLANCMPNLEN